MLLQEILKDISFLQLHLCPGHLAGHALAGNGRPVLSRGDSDSELQNLSTQLAKFPLVGRCQPAPCFTPRPPTAFVVHIWQTHALLPLNPVKLLCEGKRHTNLVRKQW